MKHKYDSVSTYYEYIVGWMCCLGKSATWHKQPNKNILRQRSMWTFSKP